jgi:hypothetical protein
MFEMIQLFLARCGMAADKVAELVAKRGGLNVYLQAVGCELSRAVRKQGSDERRAEGMWKLTGSMKKTTLILYVKAGYRVCAAVPFLAMETRKRKWWPKLDADVGEIVEAEFLRADVGWLAGLLDEEQPSDANTLRRAIVFLHEWLVADWVYNVNRRQGVAPPTSVVLQKFAEHRFGHAVGVRPREIGTVDEGRARKWAGAWRRRWGGWCGRIRVTGEEMEPAEMRSKVCTRCVLLGSVSGLQSEPGF